MGAVADIVRRYVPVSYRALVSVTNNYYQPNDLQELSEVIQYRLFSTVVGATQEASSYTRSELDLIGTLTTLQFIPAAVDYWGEHLASQSTSGTQENVSYFDHRPDLWKVYEILAAHAEELSEETGVNIKKVKAILPRVSYGDNGRGILVTEDPERFPSDRIPSVDTLGFPFYWVYPG